MMRSSLKRENQDASHLVIREVDTLKLDEDYPHWHDTTELRNAYAKGKKAFSDGDLEGAVSNLGRIPDLYRGPYLDGCYLDFALELRWEFSQLAVQGCGLLARALLEMRRFHQTLEVGQRMLEIQPHVQEGHLAVMRAQLALGQPEQVVEQFERCAEILQREYELTPNDELFEVLQQAKEGAVSS